MQILSLFALTSPAVHVCLGIDISRGYFFVFVLLFPFVIYSCCTVLFILRADLVSFYR